MTNNTLLTKLEIETNIAVSCRAPKPVGNHTLLKNSCHYYGCYVLCTLKNQQPQLELSLLFSRQPAYDDKVYRLGNILSLRIVSRDGKTVHNSSLNGVAEGVPLKGRRARYV